MTTKLAIKCIDLNSPYCPCLLSETNHCIFCSHLKGHKVCDCDWGGVCVLYEKKWQPKIKENNSGLSDLASPVRIEAESVFKITRQIGPDTYEIQFDVPSELVQSLNRTGSFVFLRRPGDQPFYHFPVGVMTINGNTVKVAIEGLGPKSARLFSDDNRNVLVRGPYYNGVFGQPWLDNINNGKILLIAGGMGQAPALSIVRSLIKTNNKVTAILAPGKIGKIFIDVELKEMGTQVFEVESMRKWGLNVVREFIKDSEFRPELIVSAGPDEQHYGIISAMNQENINIPMAATNNATMCCGEGICGSCERKVKNEVKLRTCKAQIDFNQFEQE